MQLHSLLRCSSVTLKITSYKQSYLLKYFSLSIVILFKIYQEKIAWLCAHQRGHTPFNSLVYTIYRNSKARSVDSLLQQPVQVNAIKQSLYQKTSSCVGSFCWGRLLHGAWGRQPDLMRETWEWSLTEAVLRSNGHHKEGSKLKL